MSDAHIEDDATLRGQLRDMRDELVSLRESVAKMREEITQLRGRVERFELQQRMR